VNTRRMIAYVTDLHIGQQPSVDSDIQYKMRYLSNSDQHRDNFDTIIRDVGSRGVTDIVFGGDIGAAGANEWFFSRLRKEPAKLALTLGNHDKIDEVARHFDLGASAAVRKYYYRREAVDIDLIFLDSSATEIDSDQQIWLARTLAGSTKPLVIFVHHPIFAVASPFDEQSGAALVGRKDIQRILSDSKRRIDIFCGHYHMSDIASFNNVTQHVAPAGCYQIEKSPARLELNVRQFGYRLIVLDGSEVETETVMFETPPR
jgi:3',5'-cyclic-AMP phosphodiesterase